MPHGFRELENHSVGDVKAGDHKQRDLRKKNDRAHDSDYRDDGERRPAARPLNVLEARMADGAGH